MQALLLALDRALTAIARFRGERDAAGINHFEREQQAKKASDAEAWNEAKALGYTREAIEAFVRDVADGTISPDDMPLSDNQGPASEEQTP